MLKPGQLCKTCYEAARKHFPILTMMSEVNGFLWEATGYPMVGCEVVCDHLEDLGRRSRGNCALAMEISYWEKDYAMGKFHEQEASDGLGTA